jgi:hypothetical protein
MWKEALVALFKHCPSICLEERRKARKTCQDSRSPGQDLSRGPPQYERLLITQPRRSVRHTITSREVSFITYTRNLLSFRSVAYPDLHVEGGQGNSQQEDLERTNPPNFLVWTSLTTK